MDPDPPTCRVPSFLAKAAVGKGLPNALQVLQELRLCGGRLLLRREQRRLLLLHLRRLVALRLLLLRLRLAKYTWE